MGKTNHIQPTSSKIYVDSFPEGNIESTLSTLLKSQIRAT